MQPVNGDGIQTNLKTHSLKISLPSPLFFYSIATLWNVLPRTTTSLWPGFQDSFCKWLMNDDAQVKMSVIFMILQIHTIARSRCTERLYDPGVEGRSEKLLATLLGLAFTSWWIMTFLALAGFLLWMMNYVMRTIKSYLCSIKVAYWTVNCASLGELSEVVYVYNFAFRSKLFAHSPQSLWS